MKIWLPRRWRSALDEYERMENPAKQEDIDAFLALPFPVRLLVVLGLCEGWMEAGIPTLWMPPSWRRRYLAYERHVEQDDESQALWGAMPRLVRVALCARCGFADALYELCPPVGEAWQQLKDRVVPRRIRFDAHFRVADELYQLAEEYPDGVPTEMVVGLAVHFDPRRYA